MPFNHHQTYFITNPDREQDEADPEICFKAPPDEENADELMGVIKRRQPNPGSYQLHFDDVENESSGNETILARAPAGLDYSVGPDANLNSDLRSEPASGANPSSESTFCSADLQSSENPEGACKSPRCEKAEPVAKESQKGVKFNMDVNEKATDSVGGLSGSFGISNLQGEEDFNTMSASM